MLDATVAAPDSGLHQAGQSPKEPIQFQQISALLPHRYPFLLVDRIVDYQPNQWIKGIKNINAQDILMAGRAQSHYPAALIVESIGQLGIALFNLSRGSDKPADIVLGAISEVQIASRVRPGASLQIEARIDRLLDNGLILSGRALHDGVEVLSVGSLIAMVDPR